MSSLACLGASICRLWDDTTVCTTELFDDMLTLAHPSETIYTLRCDGMTVIASESCNHLPTLMTIPGIKCRKIQKSQSRALGKLVKYGTNTYRYRHLEFYVNKIKQRVEINGLTHHRDSTPRCSTTTVSLYYDVAKHMDHHVIKMVTEYVQLISESWMLANSCLKRSNQLKFTCGFTTVEIFIGGHINIHTDGQLIMSIEMY